MIIDGRALAGEILARAKARAGALRERPRILVLVANPTPATQSYLAIKARRAADAGCLLEIRHINEHVRPSDIVAVSREADSVVIQLPLPAGMDTRALLDGIPIEKDADVLSTAARSQFAMMDLGGPSLLPPVVGAVQEIFNSYGIDPAGKRSVVVGAGFLVGEPAAMWLKRQGANVSVVTDSMPGSGNLEQHLREADIVISGAGAGHIIQPIMLKDSVILIDAGTSESNGEIVGDADPACAEKCSLFTPVPGGIGPLAVAKLFENAVTLAERA